MPGAAAKDNILIYKGSSFTRQRLLLSVLSGKSVKIVDIRSVHDSPGLQDFEINLIRLLDKITNGTIIELSETGTELFFQPGLLHGGAIEHECSLQRGIGYYLEVLVMLGVFCKIPLTASLRGVTNNATDPSVDYISAAYLPVLKKFILEDEDLSIKILRRGMMPLGGGEVVFKCPVRRHVRPLHQLDSGLVKRIRGISYALRVSPAMANRMVGSAKGVLLNFIPDVYINTDQRRGKQSGKSPGFGLHLVAETTDGIFYAAEAVSNTAEGREVSVPEDVGAEAAQKLLQQIYFGGCADPAAQSVALLFMALSQKDVSQIVLGTLSDYTVSFLRHLKEFFGVTFKVEHFVAEEETVRGGNKVQLTCVGVGYSNLNKRVI